MTALRFGARTQNALHESPIFPQRFYLILNGALVLIAPIVIVNLVPREIAILATASGFVTAFALVIANRSQLGANEILGVTAIYAASFVVLGDFNTSSPSWFHWGSQNKIKHSQRFGLAFSHWMSRERRCGLSRR